MRWMGCGEGGSEEDILHRRGRMVDACGGVGEAGGEEGRQEAARVSVSLGPHVS